MGGGADQRRTVRIALYSAYRERPKSVQESV